MPRQCGHSDSAGTVCAGCYDEQANRLAKLEKVAEAAQWLLNRTDWYSCLPGEIDNLKEALAALQERE